MITKRKKKENGWSYLIENNIHMHGIERVNMTTTSKGPLGKYAGVFVGLVFCQISRRKAAEVLRDERESKRRKARMEAA
jgi:hydrogenase maturation factor